MYFMKNISYLCTIVKNYTTILEVKQWRYSQVVRQGIANPSSPVQIWVPPSYVYFFKGVWWNGRHNRLKIC